jgi:endonuclease III
MGKSVQECFRILKEDYPDSSTELTYDTPFQLLVAVILSAQCTDARVNLTTPTLFKRFSTAEAMSKAKPAELEKLIHSCGFYRNKAKSLLSMSQDLVERFKGKVPGTLDELVTLAGVGRKTASVILNQAFDEPAIAVDTHVNRVANRLGWVNSKDPVKVEMQLRELLPREIWSEVNGLLILHGRRICNARKPLCGSCRLRPYCVYGKTVWKPSSSK